jgi:hypothetical protein
LRPSHDHVKITQNNDDNQMLLPLDLPTNLAYFPQVTQNSEVVFLADKVWQQGAAGCGGA